MKASSKHLATAVMALGLTLFATRSGQAQIQLKVDSTKNWVGYVNVFELPEHGGGYMFGSGWGTAALTAYFTGTSTLTITPNTNTWNATDAYWVTNDISTGLRGNKSLEAGFYVENTALRGNAVTFTVKVLSKNLYGGTGGHVTKAFVKTLDSGAGYSLVPGAYEFVELTNSATPYTINITVSIPAGATMIPQYGLVTTGPDVNPAWFATNGLVRVAVDNADPSITSQPVNRRIPVGGSATFSVVASGGSSVSYQWKRYSTNLVNKGNISGATNATLTLTNAQLSDETVYTCTVTDTAGSLDSDAAVLRVKTAAEFANALDDPGFEDPLLNPVTLIPKPWNTFAGSNIRSTNDNYAYTPGFPILTIDGTNAGFAYNGGEWNGIWQEVPAAPGDILVGDASVYISSLEQLFGDITGWLEVQFRAGNGLINYYKSDIIGNTSPMDTWLTLSATNGYANDYVTSIGNTRYLVAPPGTTLVRYQITVHALAGGSGVINYDGMKLMKKTRASLSSSRNGGDFVITWQSQAATSYQVVYKDNLSDLSWTPVGEAIAGDGTIKSASFATTGAKKFYAVLTL